MSERQTGEIWEDTDKGVRGLNIPDDWKRYIMEQALTKVNTPRMVLADEILEKMKQSRDVKGKLPERESIAKLISRARNLPYTDEDKPWSIAASVKYGLPPEANKDLFDMWRFSLAIGSPISIRQAKWLVHLRNLFYQPILTGNPYSDKVNRNLRLIRQSWLYSILERASRIMEEKYFDTTDLDAASFMPNWERATAVKLGIVSQVKYSQEALAKIEKYGTSLTSPPVSLKSVEQAVWHGVRSEPPQHLKMMADGTFDEVLPEEDDLVCAYWLRHLSKGPRWNGLPPRPEVSGFDHSLYHRQLAIRNELREWVKKHSPMSIRDYYALTEQHSALVLSPKLLTMVGYEVPPEDLKLYANLHENELKQEHLGWDLIPADIQRRFINDEQTPDDKKALESADHQAMLEQKQREGEFLELVRQKGGPPKPKAGSKKAESFWESVRDEWVKKYPELAESSGEYLQPETCESWYSELSKSRTGGTK